MDMKVYVSCYIPSIKQTVMRIIYIGSECTILEARDQILQALGLGEKKVMLSLGLEREEYLFSGTQVYIEALHTHIDVLHLPPQHRLEPCYTLQEEFMRHEHRSPKPGDIFKLRLLLPKFNEELKDDTELAALEAQQGRKRSLEEANCEAVMKKAKLLPQSMVSSMASLREHLKTPDPLSRPEWMELNLPVADVAKWASTDNRFATNDGRFAYMGRVQYQKMRQLISQLIAERERSAREGPRAYDTVKSPNFYKEIIGNILVVGPAGTGKSHVLAAAVSDFTEEFHRKHVLGNRRKRVVSIMDCGLLHHDRAFLVLRDALFVAFGDDDQSLVRIGNCATAEQLVHFCENTEDTLLWLLDQWQAVDGDAQLKNLLFRLTCNHCMVRVTSGSSELVEKAFHAGQPPAKLFLWDEGLGDEELECWGRWKFVSSITDGEKTKELLDETELQVLLDATGRLPVYLSAWYDALKEAMQQTCKGEKVSFEFAMKALQAQPAVDKMRDDLNAMFEGAREKGEVTKLVDGIGKYLFGAPITRPVKDIDIRYLRITDGTGAPSCGLVGAELARLVHKYKQTARFFDSACLAAVRREFGPHARSRHPVLGGALLERAVVGALAERPLVLPLGNMTPRLCPALLEIDPGAEQAAVEDLHMEFLKGGKEEALFVAVPASATYKAVDAVLLGFRRESKGCHMYIAGVQVALGKLPKHRVCRKVFMKKACVKWVPAALDMDADVSRSMNWVVPEAEMPNYPGGAPYGKEKDGFEVRSRSTIGKGKANHEVDCLEVFTSFRQVDSRLAFLDAFKFR